MTGNPGKLLLLPYFLPGWVAVATGVEERLQAQVAFLGAQVFMQQAAMGEEGSGNRGRYTIFPPKMPIHEPLWAGREGKSYPQGGSLTSDVTLVTVRRREFSAGTGVRNVVLNGRRL